VFLGRRNNGIDYVQSRCSNGTLNFQSTVDYHDHAQEVDTADRTCT
jgi:hypothetical protein